jgi:hypothetical protein
LDNTNGNVVWKKFGRGDGCAVNIDPNNKKRAYCDFLNGLHTRAFDYTQGLGALILFQNGITGTNSTAYHFVTTHHPISSNILFTADDQNIYKSTNGVSWNAASNIPWVKALEIHPTNHDTIYAASWSGNSWSFNYSFNGGSFWLQGGSPGWRVTDIESVPFSDGTVYATRNSSLSNQSHVYKSYNNGISWTAISNGLPDVSTNCIAVNEYDTNVVYVGTDLGVYISEDAGLSWIDYNDNIPPYIVMDMHFHKFDTTLRIATLGRGVWKTKSKSQIFLGVKNKLDETLFTYGPNPFSDLIEIHSKNAISNRYRINIYNNSGQKIKTDQIIYLRKTPLFYEWTGKDDKDFFIKGGIYFIEIQFDNQKQIYRIIKE